MILALALAALAQEDELPPLDPLPLPEVSPRRTKPKLPPAERFGTTGFRATLPSKGASVSTHLAFVQDFDGPSIGELTLRGHYAWQAFGVAVETVATAGASERWSSAGAGNTTLDVRGMFGRSVTHAIGLRGTFPFGADRGRHGAVSWWGTVPLATVPSWGLSLAYEGAAPRIAWNLRAGLLLGGGIFVGPDLGLLVATVQPIADRWHVVVELEAQLSVSPMHVRALARHAFGGGWTVDVGSAVPFTTFFADPSLQLLGRLERRW